MSDRHCNQRGFSLLEAVVATGLTSLLILGALAAVAHVLHTNATLAAQAALTDDALNVLSDLREATAYDADALARLAGRSTTTTLVRNGQSLTLTVDISAGGATTPVIAAVTVADANGTSVTESRQLYVEAPAPGSVIDQPSPSPVN